MKRKDNILMQNVCGENPPQKQPYVPPKATFVPLKLEERLLSCVKYYYATCFNHSQS